MPAVSQESDETRMIPSPPECLCPARSHFLNGAGPTAVPEEQERRDGTCWSPAFGDRVTQMSRVVVESPGARQACPETLMTPGV